MKFRRTRYLNRNHRLPDRLAKKELFDASISLHSFGGHIYYPWAGRYERPPDWKELWPRFN